MIFRISSDENFRFDERLFYLNHGNCERRRMRYVLDKLYLPYQTASQDIEIPSTRLIDRRINRNHLVARSFYVANRLDFLKHEGKVHFAETDFLCSDYCYLELSKTQRQCRIE